ncbi:glycoside hydrolase family 95 protein [Zopfia rhizophila CBS 207.26]|uniref:Glycoside hydrolase family 95 protein n=1 Tax=Zopfia rhizophila CBS 207.26 TaxID=1314779 RepID=A0A6A6DJT8_9PEZI|nr:glycoside hydrolase family 95 protein [Zopfia rhizophila CBS 207.26]
MLRYNTPADPANWEAALPIGNGRLGAMVYGGVYAETLRLNEESVWYGGPQSRTPDAREHLPHLRELIRDGKHREAESLVRARFFATPRSGRHLEPLGTCNIEFHHESEINGYTRTLDLENAQVTVEYSIEGNKIRRQYISTFADNVIAIHVEADEATSFCVSLTRMSDKWYETNEFLDSIEVLDGSVVMHATPGGRDSNRLCTVVAARCEDQDSSIQIVGRSLMITSKDALVIIGAQTTYRYSDVEAVALSDVSEALKKSSAVLWERHVLDWQEFYGRQVLRLWPDAQDICTDERLRKARDPGLVSLYHNYGRYLLLTSSRNAPKALPATLQGIWNPYFSPPWGSKYTININLQMNYWSANTGNLSECELPLFDLLERLAENGRRTAESMYGCRGWCCHHNADIWADTDPQDQWMPATLWPLGGAWLCTHIWEHYSFTEDKEFLQRMFPVLQSCVQFLLDFLIPDESGQYLVTNPSLSPENSYLADEKGNKAVFCEGSTIDMETIRAVFRDFLRSVDALRSYGISVRDSLDTVAMISQVQCSLPKLPEIQISPETGAIQEWGLKDLPEAELGHRHVSHLFSLYPGDSITPSSTPDLAAAALKTLESRIKHGGGHTGWSRAWLIGLYARLRKPKECAENIEALLRDSTVLNMMDSHPPVQLDGNWGGCAGVLECLMQSHEEMEVEDASLSMEGTKRRVRIIRLLPSCPAEWTKGVLKGAKARGGFELDFQWESRTIREPVIVRSLLGNDAILCFHVCGDDASAARKMVKVYGKGVHKVFPA